MTDMGEAPSKAPRRKRSWKAGLTVGAVCLAIGALIMLAAEPVEVRISEDQAQTALATQIGEPLPGMLGTTLTAEHMTVAFRADDRVAIETEIAMSGFGQSAQAQGTVTAGLRYNSPYVYLRDIDASGLEVSPASETGRRLNDLTTVIGDRLRRERDTLDPGSVEAFDRLVGDAVIALAGTVPIYDLRNAGLKGSVAALALDDVRFETEAVVLTLSSRRALGRILATIGLIAVLLAWLFGNMIAGTITNRFLDRFEKDQDGSR